MDHVKFSPATPTSVRLVEVPRETDMGVMSGYAMEITVHGRSYQLIGEASSDGRVAYALDVATGEVVQLVYDADGVN